MNTEQINEGLALLERVRSPGATMDDDRAWVEWRNDYAPALLAAAKRAQELEAARRAYASEFATDADGEPDMGSIHENIRKLKAQNQALREVLESLIDDGILDLHDVYGCPEDDTCICPTAHMVNQALAAQGGE
jgi:hypothetical protein